MRLVDLLFACRPLVLIPAWSFFLLGVGREATGFALPWSRLGLFTAVMIGVHLVNQVVDRESDRINAKGFFLQRGIFTSRDYIALSSACILASLAAAWLVPVAPRLLTASAALGLAYSMPPLRLNARPGLDLVANAVGYGMLAPALGATHVRAALVIGTALAVAAVFLHTTLLDLEGDRRTGKRSVGVALGPRVSRGLAVAFAAGSVAAAGVAGDRVVLAAAGGLTLVCGMGLFRPQRVTSRSICVGGTALYVLAAATRWPLYLPAIVALAAATRWYYARRFQIRYPAL